MNLIFSVVAWLSLILPSSITGLLATAMALLMSPSHLFARPFIHSGPGL